MSPAHSTPSLLENASTSPLDDFVAEVVAQLEAGHSPNITTLTADCPNLREPLEKLLPTLAAMVDLGHAVASDSRQNHKDNAHLPTHVNLGFSPPSCGEGVSPNIQLRTSSNQHSASSNEHPQSPTGILGDFRILREIGRGGMGVVYEAEQISLGRSVALKVLPFAAMLDSQQLARFKNEARAAATLKHPNIVSVYSVGSERGVHFYAMELIEGNSLAEVIAAMKEGVRGQGSEVRKGSPQSDNEAPTIDHRSSAAHRDSAFRNPKSAIETVALGQLSTLRSTNHREFFATAARLGLQAAEALQHAHDLGILHRDIKPGNLLLDADSQLFVTDFGLARIEADAGVTMTGDLIGTLRYMAPEQALAKRVVIDHRADVYSLGATLYELLTLQPAFGETDRSALLKQIAFEEPRSLRKLDRQIPAELETIVIKALEKNPSSRYDTAQRLADDLRAYLESRPIKAKSPSLLGLAKKWSGRHKPLVTSVVASTAALLVITLGVLASSNVAIKSEQKKTNHALQERTTALEEKASALQDRTVALNRAEWNYKKALEAVDQLLARVGNEKLAEVPQLDRLRMDVLEDTLKFYESFLAENPNDRKVQFELAKTYRRTGMMHHDFARHATATLYRGKAIAILQRLHDFDPDNAEYRYELAVALHQRGWISPLGGGSGTVAFHLRAARLLQTLHDEDPTSVEYANALADVLRSLAEGYIGDFPKIGTPVDTESVRNVLDRTFAVARLPGVNQRFLAHAHEYSGFLAVCEKHLVDAEGEYREAIRIHKLAVAAQPTEGRAREHLIRAYLALGDLFAQQERWDFAATEFREAINIGEQVRRDFPAMNNISGYASDAMYGFANALTQLKRLDEAKELVISLSPVSLKDYLIRGNLYRFIGEKQSAASDYEKVIADWNRDYGNEILDVAAAVDYFSALIGMERRQEALAFVRGMANSDIEAIGKRVKMYGSFSDRELSAEDYKNIIELYSRLVEAIPTDLIVLRRRCEYYLKRKDIHSAFEDANRLVKINPSIADSFDLRALIYSKMQLYDKEIEDYTVAVRLAPSNLAFRINRAMTNRRIGNYREAIHDFADALTIDANNWYAQINLAWLLATANDEKLRDGKRAVDLARAVFDDRKFGNYNEANVLQVLAGAYAEAGDFDKAVEKCQKAITLVSDADKDNAWAKQLPAQLNSYQSGHPWRIGSDPPKSPLPPKDS